MKYLLAILLSFSLLDASAQISVYEGTWHYQNGSERFIVQIWKEGADFFGHYKKIIVDGNGNQTSVIYNSHKTYDTGFVYPFTILMDGRGNSGLSGLIFDTTIAGNPEQFRQGLLDMKITQQGVPGCTSCTTLASWKVSNIEGLKVGIDPAFSVPSNITLTKVSNTINLD